MPFGATPSRWCVCQFHHFRTRDRMDSITVSRQKRRGLLSIANRRRQKPCGRVQHAQSDVPPDTPDVRLEVDAKAELRVLHRLADGKVPKPVVIREADVQHAVSERKSKMFCELPIGGANRVRWRGSIASAPRRSHEGARAIAGGPAVRRHEADVIDSEGAGGSASGIQLNTSRSW